MTSRIISLLQWIVWPLLATFTVACSKTPPAAGSEGREAAVYTSFEPTTWMAERISGGLVPVVCPVPEGTDPISWQPDRGALAAYQRAALVVLNGAGYEQWAKGASLPPSRVVEASAGFEPEWLTYPEATAHSHGGSGMHTHTGLDGHTWLDPLLAREEARAVLAGMCRAFPQHAAELRANARGVEADLDALHAALEALAPRLRAAHVLASHPAYGYLARRYGFSVKTIALDPEGEIGAEESAALAAEVRPGVRNLLLWEVEPSRAAAGVPAGLASVLFSPAELLSPAERAAGQDFLSVMRDNVARLERALGP
jgi:zinc transport system substrate-binding protein